jgi:hypothetical protein
VRPLQQTLLLQVGDVLMYGGQRPQVKAMGYLLKGGGVPIALHKARNKIEYLFLTAGHGHVRIIANKKRIAEVLFLPQSFARSYLVNNQI